MCAYKNIMSVLLLLVIDVTHLDATDKQYVIKKDSGLGFIKKGFSVYDGTETTLKYRVESKILRTRNRKVQIYPSKEVVGKLNHWWTWNLKADFSVLDPNSNHWIIGNITQLNKIKGRRPLIYSIYFNDQALMMENHFASNFAKIYSKSENNTLADYARRPPFNSEQFECVLNIFTNDYPDVLYILLFSTQKFLTVPRSTSLSRMRSPWRQDPSDE